MRAAAQFNRPTHGIAAAVAHGDDAHLVSVFFAEESAGAGSSCVIDRHDPRCDRRILQHDFVGNVLDLFQFRRTDRLRMREVETQTIRRDEGAFLRHVIAEHLAQSFVQKMRGRVIVPDRAGLE